MPKRKPAVRGLAYQDANRDRLVGVEADVLDIKSQIEDRWPSLEVFRDEIDGVWVVVEHCLDGVDRFLLETEVLDGRLIERIHKADARVNPDWEGEIDKANEEVIRKMEDEWTERAGDFGERLIHAFKKDGFYKHTDIYGPKPRRLVHGNLIR